VKILLSTINISGIFTPLALLYLKASILNNSYLKDKVEVEIKEFHPLDTDDSILWEIRKYNP